MPTLLHRILFVCHGNICRSPMAEFMFKQMVARAGRAREFVIDSAAVSREEIGHDVYPPARRCLERHGVDCGHHAARQVVAADFARFDRILLMDHDNLRRLERMFPAQTMAAGSTARVELLMALTGTPRDVADPWYTGDFEQTYNDLLQALPHLL